jgi:hypothetical protein
VLPSNLDPTGNTGIGKAGAAPRVKVIKRVRRITASALSPLKSDGTIAAAKKIVAVSPLVVTQSTADRTAAVIVAVQKTRQGTQILTVTIKGASTTGMSAVRRSAVTSAP